MTLAHIPIILEKIKKEDIDKQIIRTGILEELHAINLYEQMANLTENENLKAVLMAVAKVKKEYVGEFQYLLLKYDNQQEKELKEGMEEVKALLGEK